MSEQKVSGLSNPVLASALAMLCAFLWGSAYPAVKLGYELFAVAPDDTAGKLAFAGIRFTIAGLMVLVFHAVMNRRKDTQASPDLRSLHPDQWIRILLLGLMQTTVHYYFYYIGLSYTSGAKASILNSLTVFFSAILAHLFHANDRLTSRKGIGIVIGLVAVILVNYEHGLGISFLVRGEGFIMTASFLAAASSLYTKRASRTIDPVLLTGAQLAAGGALLLAIGLLSGAPLPNGGVAGFALLTYMALLSALAFSLWSSLLKHNKVSSITVYYLMIPVFGTLLSALILGESIVRLQYVIALPAVAMGIYLVNGQSADLMKKSI